MCIDYYSCLYKKGGELNSQHFTSYPMLTFEPIGTFHTFSKAPYDLPRQGSLGQSNKGTIQLNKGCQFEQALEGLSGFDLIWVVFRFHQSLKWKPKVLPPRGGDKQGVFATRSPHRPNFIGFSCVKLQEIKGLALYITNHDLLDGTPILDLKPYLNYADSLTSQRQGWTDNVPPVPEMVIEWSGLAQTQIDYLKEVLNLPLQTVIEHRLVQSPFPYANNRVKRINEREYELAYKTWRISYIIEENRLIVNHLKSGYDQETMSGQKQSKWDDVPIHQAFNQYFNLFS